MAISRASVDVRKRLNDRGKSHQWLADECKAAQSTISRVLAGKWTPDVVLAAKIERAVGTPIAWWAEPQRGHVHSARKRRARSGEAVRA